MNHPLVIEEYDEHGDVIYKMKTFNIEVIAKLTGGIAPTITYMYNNRDVTDDIRALRFYYENPADIIEDFTEFQAMLFQKEQRAINALYESISIKPKNMSTPKQVLWAFFVFVLVILPLFAVLLLK